MNNKFEFTGEIKVYLGITFRQIRAKVDCKWAKAGDVGGWIEKEESIQHSGNAWVSADAWVSGDAHVHGNGLVYGDAHVYGFARVHGNARVHGDAWVYGDAWVNKPILCATRSDGHTFTVTQQNNGESRITAGCRLFTFPEARQWWTATRLGTPLGEETFSILDHLERMARIQGWIK